MSQQCRLNNLSVNLSHFDETIYQDQANQFPNQFQQQWNFPGAGTASYPVLSSTGTIPTVRTVSIQSPARNVSFQQGNKRAQYDNIDPNLQDPRYLALPDPNGFPTVHHHSETSADPLTRYYQEDDPWNHVRYSNANVGFNQPQHSFGQQRQRLCSDGGSTVPASDSGYYTQQERSVLSGEPGRPQLELPSDLMNQTKNLNVDNSPTESQAMARRPSSHGSVSQYSTRSAGQKQQFHCPEADCSVVSRCQSEHKKHMLKHHKEFTCDFLGCKRAKQGFSTTNDLERHQKSVHKIGLESSKSWRCAVVNCSNRGKVWLRMDNFKQHIGRMHKEEEVFDLIQRSEHNPQNEPPAPQPISVDPAHLLAGIGTEHSVATENSNNSSLPLNISYPPSMSFCGRSMSNNVQVSPSADDMDRPFAQFDSTLLALPSAKSSPRQRLPNTAANFQDDPPISRKSSQRSQANVSRVWHPARKAISDRKSMPQLTLTTGAQTKSEQQREALALSKAIAHQYKTSLATGPVKFEEVIFRALCAQQQMEDAGTGPPQVPSSGSKATSATVGTQKCPYTPCGFVGRNCDLNKHIKRHLKPFGCTYPKCYKRFGAKSDWKRHENSQHFQQEAFRCDYGDVSKPEEKCGQHFYRAAQFQKHLGEHKISSSDRIQIDSKRCKIGKNCQGQYWCGFCGIIKALERVRNEAWDERFDHIAHHFDKEKKCIDDWVCVEENRTKEQIRKDMKTEPSVDDETGSSGGEKDNDTGVDGVYRMPTRTVDAGSLASRYHQGTSNKRSAPQGIPEAQRAAKRTRTGRTTLVNHCCICGYSGGAALQSSCMECQHIFCSSCSVEEVAPLTFDN